MLLVGDHADSLGMYQAALSVLGFNAHTAPPSAETARSAETRNAEIIVTLLPCTEVSGWELIEIMRNERMGRPAPVVVLADRDDPEIRTHAEALGCAAVLMIPCLPDHLAEVLRRVLAIEQVQ